MVIIVICLAVSMLIAWGIVSYSRGIANEVIKNQDKPPEA